MSQRESPYDQIRADIRAQIHELQKALDTIDRVEAIAQRSTAVLPPEVPQWVGPSVRHASLSYPKGAPTWADTIHSVLMKADRPMLVEEIVKELDHEGRKFPANTPPAVIVRSTLSRCKKPYGWVGDGEKPQRWTIGKERRP